MSIDLSKVAAFAIKAAEYGAKYGDVGVALVKEVIATWTGDEDPDWDVLVAKWEKTPKDYLTEAGVDPSFLDEED